MTERTGGATSSDLCDVTRTDNTVTDLSFARWRCNLLTARRGPQSWASREAVYTVLTRWEEPTLPTLKAMLRAAGVSRTTFYQHFGRSGARWRSLGSDAMANAVAEAKAWSWEPYAEGIADVAARVELTPRTRLDATIQALAASALWRITPWRSQAMMTQLS